MATRISSISCSPVERSSFVGRPVAWAYEYICPCNRELISLGPLSHHQPFREIFFVLSRPWKDTKNHIAFCRFQIYRVPHQR